MLDFSVQSKTRQTRPGRWMILAAAVAFAMALGTAQAGEGCCPGHKDKKTTDTAQTVHKVQPGHQLAMSADCKTGCDGDKKGCDKDKKG